MLKGKVTIKDIARELGISPSTVSKALKSHSDISATTKKAVRALVRKWNYHPDPIALSLKGGLSKTIGVIVLEREINGCFCLCLFWFAIGRVLRFFWFCFAFGLVAGYTAYGLLLTWL